MTRCFSLMEIHLNRQICRRNGSIPVLATSEVMPSRAVRALEGEGMGLSHLEGGGCGAG